MNMEDEAMTPNISTWTAAGGSLDITEGQSRPTIARARKCSEYGNGGELATNRREDQELAVLCLHLLQASLVYINTLMIQQILDDPAAAIALGPDDLRGLSPLLWSHVNPYGVFRLDLSQRLPLAA